MRLPEGVDALTFGEEWSEDQRLEYGKQEGTVDNSVSNFRPERGNISFLPFHCRTVGVRQFREPVPVRSGERRVRVCFV